MVIFYEPQSGGLCRKHAINAYFGSALISTSEFCEHQVEYDAEYKKKFNLDTSCSAFDIVSSDQKNVVSYILKKYNIYTHYYALNQIYQKDIHQYITKILDGTFFFIYTESHIYGAKLHNNKWHIVDSMSGVRVVNINTLTSTKNIGFIVPVNTSAEFYRNVATLQLVLYNKKKYNYKQYRKLIEVN